jgi:MFS family permease
MAEERYTGTPSGKPTEVTWVSILVAVNAIAGIVIAGVDLAYADTILWWHGEVWGTMILIAAGIGLILGFIGLWIAMGLYNIKSQFWQWAFILNVIAVPLYSIGEEWWGALISLFIIFYLHQPATKKHYM